MGPFCLCSPNVLSTVLTLKAFEPLSFIKHNGLTLNVMRCTIYTLFSTLYTHTLIVQGEEGGGEGGRGGKISSSEV